VRPQVLRDASDPPFDEADCAWCSTELRIGDQLGFDELSDPTTRRDLAEGAKAEDARRQETDRLASVQKIVVKDS
jgi:hypothetical protein